MNMHANLHFQLDYSTFLDSIHTNSLSYDQLVDFDSALLIPQ